MSGPKVSIYSACYNQKNTIKKCLDSILAQKTNFDFEIIIKDDCSTDGTIEIIKEYQKKYPKIIKPVYETENQFSKHRAMETFYEAVKLMNGEYLAICEGDDYWVDENKLQTQVDFLDKNPDFSGCFHRVEKKDVVTGKNSFYLPSDEQILRGGGVKSEFDINEAVKNYCFGIASCMFRLQKYKKDLLDTNAKCIINWDSYIIYYFAIKGKLKYLSDLTSVSVMGENNIWCNMTKTVDERNIKYALEIINFPIEVRKLFDKFNCSQGYETPESAMRRVLYSVLNIKKFNYLETISKSFPDVFKNLITETPPNYNYYKRKIRKYKKQRTFLIVFSILLLIILFLKNYSFFL